MITWCNMGDKDNVLSLEASLPYQRAQAGLVCSCPPHDRCLWIVQIQNEMDSELVLCLTGLLWITGWIPGETLGCMFTRQKVEPDAASVHVFHYNHRVSSESTSSSYWTSELLILWWKCACVKWFLSLDFRPRHGLHLGQRHIGFVQQVNYWILYTYESSVRQELWTQWLEIFLNVSYISALT